MHGLLPTLLEGLSPEERQGVLRLLATDHGVAHRPLAHSAAERPVAAPAPTRVPRRTTYRPRPTAAQLDRIAGAPWRGRT